MLQIAYAIIWWFILLVIGLLTFPLVSRVCGRLPDKGYSISKILGLLLLTYFSWMFASLHLLKFGFINIAISLLILLALSLYLGGKQFNLKNLPLKSMLITEAIFAVAFGLFLFVLSHKPDLTILYSEDFTDFGFLQSILRSDYFPPTDPWLAGKSIPYYYGGHLISAVLITLSRIPHTIAYNLAVAMFFALAVCAAYGLGYNATKRKLFGFVSVVFVCLAGFISGAYQLTAFLSGYTVMGYTPLDAPNIGEWFRSFDFVTANRIIPGTVTHYPYYAYLVGDMHANIMDIPFQLMFMTMVLSLLTKGEPVASGLKTDAMVRIFILGLSLGILAFVNTWSYPIYLCFIVLAFLLLKTNLSKKGIISVIVLSFLLYLPYHLSRGAGSFKDLGWVDGKTNLSDFFEIFALPMFATLSLFFVLFSRKWFAERKFLIIAFLITAVTVIIAALIAVFLHLQIIWILAPLIVIPLYYIYKSCRKEETQFMLLLTLVGALVVLFCEILFIDDPLGGEYERYNMILKVYVPICVVWGVSAAYGVFFVSSKLRRNVKAIWVVVLLAFVLAALIHPIASTTSWAGGRYAQVEGHRLTLDGMAYLEYTNKGDYEAIRWLNDNVKGAHVILEIPGVAMQYSSQASSLTGLPTLMGWAGWEVMWRDSWEIITERTMAINAIYQAPDSEEALALLKKYKVEYIYVGSLERNGTSGQKGYPAESLQKFAADSGRYQAVYQNEDVIIYHVVP
jgi:YYY domain-containing protein